MYSEVQVRTYKDREYDHWPYCMEVVLQIQGGPTATINLGPNGTVLTFVSARTTDLSGRPNAMPLW